VVDIGENWDMFGGEFSVTLDDASRIALPRRIRDVLETDKIVITKGIDKCLWLYTTDEWEKLENQIFDGTNLFDDEDRTIRQRIIGPNQVIDIDKQGRILIPPTLRIYAGLNKDCIVLGQRHYIEIWAEGRYQAHLEASEEEFKAARRKLADRIKRERDLAYDSSRSGAVGTGIALPCAEGRE
jgi:MraZ protein